MAVLTVVVPEVSDLPQFLELISEQLEEGFTSGHVAEYHHWELS